MTRTALLASLGAPCLLMVLTLAAVAHGSTPLPWADVLSALSGPLAPAWGLPEVAPSTARIITDLRLPRAVLAALVGAGLAMVGVLLQTTTRNDLADPFLFGLSSGASAGAVAVITVTGERLGIWTLPLAALSGGLLAAAVVLFIVHRLGTGRPGQLILAGLASSFLFGALTHYLVFAGDQRAAHSVLFWTLGGLGLARWENLPLALAGLAVLLVFTLRRHRQLDAMLAGDEIAHSLGARPSRLRMEAFAVSALATGCFVALTGVIGFIGLMVPHLARAISGTLHLRLLLNAAVMGALLLIASDLACRTLLAPQELPVGIVTGALGGVFVLYLVLRHNHHH